MKSRAYLEYASAKGVEWFVVDSVEEIFKVQSVKADAKMYLRIDAPNIGSDWPLAGKFGAHMNDVPDFIEAAVECKADLAGVTKINGVSRVVERAGHILKTVPGSRSAPSRSGQR